MIGYVYLTTNLINNKKYIGKRQKSTFDTKYLGSGIHLKSAIAKYGRDNFSCEVLQWCETVEELNLCEKYFIEKHNALSSNEYYNIAAGGDGGNTGRCYKGMAPYKEKHSEETKRKMSEARMGHSTSQSTKDKISASNSGKKRTEAQNEANRQRNIGKIWMNKDGKQTTIHKDRLDEYLSNGWVRGRLPLKGQVWNKGLTKETSDSLMKMSVDRKKKFLEVGSIGCYGLTGQSNANSSSNRLKRLNTI